MNKLLTLSIYYCIMLFNETGSFTEQCYTLQSPAYELFLPLG